ncbi:MAG: hypothetical protein AMXMBFR31_10030 [Candidatus Desulfobacillus denitrificans]|nr:hypothetical protein [Candidatus Hydrogenedentota bacterium]MCZ2174578.1 hypothetical protein [Burkholderiales bacterium]
MRKWLLYLSLALLLPFSALAAGKVTTGTWYDDLGSPSYGDATLTIEKEGDRYFLSRRNGDGSGGRYQVERKGTVYTKIGDKFGAKYIVTEKGLEIHDKAGYIRTAKKK